ARRDAARAHAGDRVFRRDLLRDLDGRIRHGVHARHADQRAAAHDLQRVHELRELLDGGVVVDRARPHHVGRARGSALARRRGGGGGGMRRLRWWLQLGLTLAVCAFLVVPIALSILAGVTENFFVGVKSGLTLRWVAEVWRLYSETVWRSIGIAFACLAATL